MALASALVSVMIDAVRKTARPMLRDFGEVAQLQVSRKGPGDFVTAADIKAEDTLFELLMKARPGYGFLGEERGLIEGTDKSHMWIVDGRRDLSESLIATGLPFIGKTGHAQAIKDLHAIGQRVAGIRRLGSAALDFAWVAAGRYDAFYERNLQPWDVAAGILFVTEAGGIVTTIDGEGRPETGAQILATNSDLHPQLLKVLRA